MFQVSIPNPYLNECNVCLNFKFFSTQSFNSEITAYLYSNEFTYQLFQFGSFKNKKCFIHQFVFTFDNNVIILESISEQVHSFSKMINSSFLKMIINNVQLSFNYKDTLHVVFFGFSEKKKQIFISIYIY